MGPCEIIGSRHYIFQWAHPSTLAVHCVKFNGPMRNDRQWPLHMPMGPSGYISGAPYEKQWAHAKPLIAASVHSNGPTRNIQPLSNNGPMWAFPSSLVKLHMGSIDYDDKYLLHGLKFHCLTCDKL